jgi:class 3 adenylate cyclase/alpha-beta hydrolase superfamily lysophospholipase
MTPETRYARTTDGTHVAYQVHGDGPVDIVVMRSWHSNLDNEWTDPILAGILRRLGAIGRVILLDRRGTGLSDRFDHTVLPTIEDRIDDIRSVLAAIGSSGAVLLGLGPGCVVPAAFAAFRPEQTVGLVLWGPTALVAGRDGPWAHTEEEFAAWIAAIRSGWGTRELAHVTAMEAAPSRADDEAFIDWLVRDMQLSGSTEDAAAQAQLAAQTDVGPLLSAIHVPTLVCWRAGGMPDTGRATAARIAGAIADELPGEDHALIGGDWRLGLARIEAFIEDLEAGAPDADRVLATVMFTDIVGSTQLAADLGDRAWRALLDRHHALIRRELARHRGREVDTAGDGFFAAFDGPGRSIRCAAAIRDGVSELDLRLRIGVHAGECERVGAGLRGVAVHVGARIGAAAEPDEILVSSTVRDLVAGSGIGFEDAGRQSLKGVPEEWQLYRVASV